MIIRVHLVTCDRPGCNAQRIPLEGHTPGAARYEAVQNGWARIRVPAGNGTPAAFEDLCPAHAIATTTNHERVRASR